MNYPEYWRRPVYGSRQEMLFELIHHIYYNMDNMQHTEDLRADIRWLIGDIFKVKREDGTINMDDL